MGDRKWKDGMRRCIPMSGIITATLCERNYRRARRALTQLREGVGFFQLSNIDRDRLIHCSKCERWGEHDRRVVSQYLFGVIRELILEVDRRMTPPLTEDEKHRYKVEWMRKKRAKQKQEKEVVENGKVNEAG